MGFDDFVVYMFLYVGLAKRTQRQKMSSPDKEKMNKKTAEFLAFVFDLIRKEKKDDKDKDRVKANGDGKADDKSK